VKKMKAWHALLPLLAVASIGFAFEKRERDAAISELRAARDAAERSGPIMQRASSAIRSDGQSQERKSATGSDMRDQYQRAFAGETADATWAGAAERLAADRLKATVPAGSIVRTIECRTSLCRIETSHADPSSSQKFVHNTFMTPSMSPWNAAAFSALLEPSAEHGPLRLVSYLAREGHSLPSVE
jgi:hypothetical protein